MYMYICMYVLHIFPSFVPQILEQTATRWLLWWQLSCPIHVQTSAGSEKGLHRGNAVGPKIDSVKRKHYIVQNHPTSTIKLYTYIYIYDYIS